MTNLAEEMGYSLYIVGGPVRDFLLGREGLDLDLVLEGNAILLAERLSREWQARLVVHRRFLTAKLKWPEVSLDLASARQETYPHPGALPMVSPADIAIDLKRRDYTINAMAIALSGEHRGQLVDYYHGYDNLQSGLLRVLHESSFIDDPTRILRGIRYEQRFDFRFEEDTFLLLQEAIPRLSRISGSRIRNEIERTLEELEPEKAICRAGELGILSQVYPSLKVGEWLSKGYQEARRLYAPLLPPSEIYWAILGYHLDPQDMPELGKRLKLPRKLREVMEDTISLRDKLHLIAGDIRPSALYHILQHRSPIAVRAAWALNPSSALRQKLELYLDHLRYVKPAFTGDDLITLGIKPGPEIKLILENLLNARLDGAISKRTEEEALVRKWIEEHCST